MFEYSSLTHVGAAARSQTVAKHPRASQVVRYELSLVGRDCSMYVQVVKVGGGVGTFRSDHFYEDDVIVLHHPVSPSRNTMSHFSAIFAFHSSVLASAIAQYVHL